MNRETYGLLLKLALVILVTLLLLPFVPLVIWSFAARWAWPDLIPSLLSARSWSLVLDPEGDFLKGYLESCLTAFGAMTASILLIYPLARWLTLSDSRFKPAIEILAFAPLLISPYVAAMGMHEIFVRLQLEDTGLSAILAHTVVFSPYMLRVLIVGFLAKGERLEQQAQTLGGGSLFVLWRVTLPRMKPAIGLGCSFVFLASMGEYVLTNLVASEIITLPAVLYPYVAAGDRSVAAAGSLLLMSASIVLLILLELLLHNKLITRDAA